MINKVYRVVQVVLNKNGMGVITPDRFNDIAHAVQAQIFSELPNDLRLAENRLKTGRGDGARMYLQDALDRLNVSAEIVRSGDAPYDFFLPDDFITAEGVYCSGSQAERVNGSRMEVYDHSGMVKPTPYFPVYSVAGNRLRVLPKEVLQATLYYKRSAKSPRWTYVTVGGHPVFNASDPAYCDFELGDYFFVRIVSDMLTYFGLHLKEPEVVQLSQQEQNDDFRKENMS